MRIISGSHKGRRIIAPKKLPVRPTSDRSKEAIFNILQHQYDLENTVALDLFSGTGNISYEFGSRGAKNITAVDQNRMCVDFIRKTSKILELNIQVIQMKVIKYLSTKSTSFDLIFADPPYDMEINQYVNMIETIFENNILKQEGLLIIEHVEQKKMECYTRFFQSKKYGNSVFSFFK